MQYELHLDQKAGVIFVRYGTVLNKAIILAASRDVNSLPDLKPGTPVFVDFRECVDIDLSSDDTREIATYMLRYQEKRGSFRIAQLVSSKVMFGVSRMSAFTIDEKAVQIKSFEDVAPALDWVGLSAGYKLPFTSLLE